MERQALICPVCGAPHRRAVPSGVAQVRCSYCSAMIIVPTNAPFCPNHPDLLATAICNDCGGNYCRDCLTAYEIRGESEGGVLQLCSDCLARRHLGRAERTVLLGLLFVLFGIFFVIASPVLGILWIALFAVPTIVYGLYSARRSNNRRAFLFREQTASRKEKPYRPVQEIYQDLLADFVRSFGMVHGSLMLENRIKAYMEEGLSREESIRKFAEDEGY